MAEITEVLLAVWVVYLYRISNQKNVDFLLNYSRLNNLIEDFFPLVSHELPFSVCLNDSMCFEEVLKLVALHFREIKRNFTYIHDIKNRHCVSKNTVSAIPIAVIVSEEIFSDLNKIFSNASLIFLISSGGKKISWILKKDIVKKEPYLLSIVNNMPGHFQVLLVDGIEKKKDKITELELLTAKERHQILVDWNNTKTDYPHHKTIHQLFEEQARKTPNNVAISCEGEFLTYVQLNHKSNQLAHYLKYQNIKVGQFVVICTDPCLEMIIAILGVLKAGAAYVPIDTSSPSYHVQTILKDCGATVAISRRNFTQNVNHFLSLDKLAIQVIYMDSDWPLIKKYSIKNIPACSSEDIAYVIYTSGTTGKPKDVLVRHKSVVNLAIDQIKKLKITTDSRVLQFSPISFDASVWEIFSTLLGGATLCIPIEKKS